MLEILTINNTNNKIRSLLTQYSFYNNDEPTYITEHSSSTLDLLIVNDHRNIVFSGVGAPLLNRTHYHLPIIGFLNHYIERSTIIRRKMFLCDRGDYYAYRQKLSTIDWDSMFTGHDIDSITWNGERVDAIGSNRGKLDTYFYIKTHFGKEKYFTN